MRDPANLVLLSDNAAEGTSSGDLIGDAVSYPFYRHLRANNQTFQDLCAFREGEDRVRMHVTDDPESRIENVPAHLVSGNYFDVLGVEAAAGRLLRDSDDSPSAAPVAVMSYALWQSRFHLDPAVLGKTVMLNGTAFTVVGVAASSFFGERIRKSPDFWLPLSFQPQVITQELSIDRDGPLLGAMDHYWLNCLGRLKPGVTLKAAQTEVNTRLHSFYLAQAGANPTRFTREKIDRVTISLKPGGSGISIARDRYSKPLGVLMAAVALVLLIACANVATLLLARASARRQEFLCRLALGAARSRLLRQLLTESLLLALLGGLAGAAFAWWAVKALVLLIPLGPTIQVGPDPTVLAFATLVSITAGILFGIVPGWKLSHLDLRPANMAPPSRRSHRFGNMQILTVAQVALSLCLLVGAGLLARSLVALETQNLGFTRDRILLAHTELSFAGYRPSQFPNLYREIGARIGALPGVQSAAVARFSPISGYDSSYRFSLPGYQPPPNKEMRVWDLPVGPRFFETLKIPLLLGRPIDERDTASSPLVVVVNREFAKQYLPATNPIGGQLGLGPSFELPAWEIVGVVEDSKFFDLRDNPHPMAFFAISQRPLNSIELLLRTAADPRGTVSDLRAALKTIDPRLPLLSLQTLDRQIESSLKPAEMIASLSAIFGVLALLLAAIGIYGTLAYSVAARTAEIGTRMAIGAQKHHVLMLVLRDLVAVLVAGLAVGLPFALAGTRWLKSFLFGVEPLDPLALSGAVALIAAIALLAGYLPARRATTIDPMRSLRHE